MSRLFFKEGDMSWGSRNKCLPVVAAQQHAFVELKEGFQTDTCDNSCYEKDATNKRRFSISFNFFLACHVRISNRLAEPHHNPSRTLDEGLAVDQREISRSSNYLWMGVREAFALANLDNPCVKSIQSPHSSCSYLLCSVLCSLLKLTRVWFICLQFRRP